MMEELRVWIDELSHTAGLEGTQVIMATDTVLVVFTLLLSWLSYVVCHRLVLPLTVKITEKTAARWDDVLLNDRNMRKACMIAPAIVIWMFIPHIFFRMPDVEMLLERITAIYITMASTKLLLGIVNSMKMLDSDVQSTRRQYLHTFCGVLKITILFLSVIVIVAIIINRSPLTLLAGLGATSAILMLVFKDTISGLVAGIRLTSNDMLHKGDWITVEKAGVNGVVEEITLTTVKVRNFDNTIVTITPQTLVDDSFQNWKAMQEGEGRRVTRCIYIDVHSICRTSPTLLHNLTAQGYIGEGCLLNSDDARAHPVNLSLFRLYIDRMLATHPDINPDMTYMVRQLPATPTGLPVELYFFLHQKQWKPYENQKDEIMEAVYASVADFGLRIYQRSSSYAPEGAFQQSSTIKNK